MNINAVCMELRKWEISSKCTICRVLDGRCNVYLVITRTGNILIDTGTVRSRRQLINNIKQVGINDIQLLVLTHTHFDHCANVSALKEEYGCRIVMGKNESRFVEKGYTYLPTGTNWFTAILARVGNSIGDQKFGYKPFYPDVLIEERTPLERFEGIIEVIPTPGHSPGSISIAVNNEIALVGDTMFGILRNSIFPPFADDVPTLIRSWKELLGTGCKLFLPGHGREIPELLVERSYAKHDKKIKN